MRNKPHKYFKFAYSEERRETQCWLIREDGERYVSYAYCHPNDTPDPAKGRKIAAARAIAQAVPSDGQTDQLGTRIRAWYWSQFEREEEALVREQNQIADEVIDTILRDERDTRKTQDSPDAYTVARSLIHILLNQADLRNYELHSTNFELIWRRK